MNILLVCACGASTSLIVEKMRDFLADDEKDWVIEAKAIGEFEKEVEHYDVVLLGPQIRFRKNSFQKIGEKYNVPVDAINSIDYGTCRGDKILQAAKELYKKHHKK